MIVQLTHPFLWRCFDRDALFAGVEKFNDFCQNLEKQAELHFPITGEESEEVRNAVAENIQNYKGECFELFTESMIKLFPCDKRIVSDPRRPEGDDIIENYQINDRIDIGVDGFGISANNGKPFTVQCKYRRGFKKVNGKSVPLEINANEDHLTNFTSASLLHYGVDQHPDPQTLKCNMLIVTSASALNWFTNKEMFGEMVYVFCRKNIQELVDKSGTFWKYFPASWEESLKELKGK